MTAEELLEEVISTLENLLKQNKSGSTGPITKDEAVLLCLAVITDAPLHCVPTEAGDTLIKSVVSNIAPRVQDFTERRRRIR